MIMKKLILSISIALFLGTGSLLFTSCNNNPENSQKTKQEHPQKDMGKQDHQLYACPMHPEATGKKDDKCPKCGMKLTEPAEKK